MEFLVRNYRCLQNPWLGGYRTPDPRSVFCPQLNLLNPPPKQIPGYATGQKGQVKFTSTSCGNRKWVLSGRWNRIFDVSGKSPCFGTFQAHNYRNFQNGSTPLSDQLISPSLLTNQQPKSPSFLRGNSPSATNAKFHIYGPQCLLPWPKESGPHYYYYYYNCCGPG